MPFWHRPQMKRGFAMRFATRKYVVLLATFALLAVSAAQADYDAGLNYFKQGKYVEAAQEFQALVDQSPEYDYGYYILGLSFLKMDKLPDAEKNFRKAVEINGDKFEYHHGLAQTLMGRKQYRETVNALNAAEGLASSTNHKYALYSMRGSALASQRKWGESVDDLEKARAIKKSPTLSVQLGKAYYALEHNDKAVPVFREALAQNPNDAESQELLSEALIKLAKESRDDASKTRYYRDAVASAEKFRSLKSGDPEGPNLVGKATLGAQDYPKAEQAFRAVLQMKPDHCYAMINLGKTYIAMNDYKNAEKPFKDAAQCAPRQPTVYESLGLIYQKYGSEAQNSEPQKAFAYYDQAKKYYRQAEQIKPSSFIAKAVQTIDQNIEVIKHNMGAEELEKAQAAAEQAEQDRVAEEERKRKEWEAKRRRDG